MNNLRLSLCLLAFMMLSIAGCTPVEQAVKPECPYIQTLSDAEELLNVRNSQIVPIKAAFDGKIRLLNENKTESINRGVIITEITGSRSFMKCGVSLVDNALSLGSSTDQFWYRVNIGDVSEYYWGHLQQFRSNCVFPYGMSPNSMKELFGFVDIDSSKNIVKLAVSSPFNVLEYYALDGELQKKVYIDPCTGYVEMLEYYTQSSDLPQVIISHFNYTLIEDIGVTVPERVEIRSIPDRVQLTMKFKKFREANIEKLSGKYLTRPEPKEKRVYLISEDCDFIPQN